ncbi:site-specific integrase [Kitasatospora sp. NPDC001683]
MGTHRRAAVLGDGLDAGATGAFLDQAAGDRLYALFHLITFRGLRRGEACGQRWADTNLKAGLLTVAKQLVVDGWAVYEDDPKTDAGARTIALDSETVAVLAAHRERQRADREQWCDAWVETGRVFTKENGEWLHPTAVTDRFRELAEGAGLPPIRLHDLRHGAASLAHAAGADLHSIKEMLGHSSIGITSDTYTTLLPQVDRAIAEAAAQLVPRANRPRKAVQSTANPQPTGSSAHASLTQTASDEKSEAGDEAPKRPNLQLIRGGNESPLSGSNRRPPLYKDSRSTPSVTCGAPILSVPQLPHRWRPQLAARYRLFWHACGTGSRGSGHHCRFGSVQRWAPDSRRPWMTNGEMNMLASVTVARPDQMRDAPTTNAVNSITRPSRENAAVWIRRNRSFILV